MKKLIILLALFSLDASAKKMICTDINGKALLWDVEGKLLPPNCKFDAPADAEHIDDLDVNLASKVALVNNLKKAKRIADEAALQQQRKDKAAQLRAECDAVKTRFETGKDSAADLNRGMLCLLSGYK